MQKHGVHNPNFKGFMVDSAQAKFNVVWRIFGYGNPTISVVDKKTNMSPTLDLIHGEAHNEIN